MTRHHNHGSDTGETWEDDRKILAPGDHREDIERASKYVQAY
jgi:hypothetical protein